MGGRSRFIAESLLEEGQPAYYTFFRDTNITDKIIEKCYQLDLFGEVKRAEIT